MLWAQITLAAAFFVQSIALAVSVGRNDTTAGQRASTVVITALVRAIVVGLLYFAGAFDQIL
jgi:hypothetical protein